MPKLGKLYLTSLAVLLLFFVVILPFEVPDEQAHYASVHFLVEEGRMPTGVDKLNLSKEEMLAERVFGVMSEGENKYSRHPEYRIPYSDSFIGPQEEEVKALNTPELRTTYTIHQAALYPPLYYYFASLFYRVAYSADLVIRVFTIRLASLLLAAAFPLLIYLFAKRSLARERDARIIAALSVLFPMTTYLGVGINPDNLHNPLFTTGLILALDLLLHGWDQRRSLLIGTVVGLDLLTKPQGYILIPIIGIAILMRFRRKEISTIFKHLPYLLLPPLLIAGWYELPKFFLPEEVVGGGSYFARTTSFGGAEGFRQFVTGYLNTHIREMVVWYWGVFKWFGILLPRPFWWLANRIFLLSAIGIVLQLFKEIRNKKFSFQGRVIIFSILANLVYVAALFWFDWQFYQDVGRSLGLQARYYYPLLATQLILFYQGLLSLAWTNALKRWVGYGLLAFFLALHFAGLYTELTSYYDLYPLTTLWQQISQYKPFFAKGYWWLLWLALYLIGLASILRFALSRSQSAKLSS